MQQTPARQQDSEIQCAREQTREKDVIITLMAFSWHTWALIHMHARTLLYWV